MIRNEIKLRGKKSTVDLLCNRLAALCPVGRLVSDIDGVNSDVNRHIGQSSHDETGT